MRKIAFFLLLLIASSCGVKAPPIAPQRDREPDKRIMNCSPKDEDCDETDDQYQPQLTKAAK